MSSTTIFTSESVAAGHPDKIADQLSDAVLDALLAEDQHCRVACETLVKTGMVLIAGEISTTAWVDLEDIARKTLCDLGYNHADIGFDGKTCAVLNAIGKQSPDIAQGVDGQDALGAGDQGLMFGYACKDTDVLMPAPITLSHRLMERHGELKQSSLAPWIWPDAKCQVSVIYRDGQVQGIDSIVFSTQHAPDVSLAQIESFVREEIIKPVIPAHWLTDQTRYFINPTGRFVIGGPQGDCGLTGRKIIVDTYGGMARHGGGCFSGKDPSKVDRSAAYMARHVAKSIVASDLAERCEIQLAYAIGVAEPTAIHVDTFGTGRLDEQGLIVLVREHFDLTPQGIIDHLDLLKPGYQKTAAYGHFGREDQSFTWEQAKTLA